MTRTILAPLLDDDFAAEGRKTYWKRVLPLRKINYTDRSGRARVIDFNEKYLANLTHSFTNGALDNRSSAPFVLADKDNTHTMDPERYRGDMTALVRESELPEKVKQRIIASEGALPAGLYGRVEFPSAKAAKAVVLNPRLPVSMRIRESVERSDGQHFDAVPIHLLGTMDPKIPGLGDWVAADAEMSEYAHDELINLSEEPFESEDIMQRGRANRRDVELGGGTATVPDIADVDVDEIEDWTDEQLTAFLQQHAPEELAAMSAPTEPDGDEDEGDETDDTEDESEPEMSEQRSYGDVQLAEAQRTARAALKRAAGIEWQATRSALVREGVPPYVLDLAEPVLSRANDTVVDLSNFDEDDINVTEIVRELVDGYKGVVDMSVPAGHGGSDEADQEQGILDRFANETAGL